jgi:hypothetical protein
MRGWGLRVAAGAVLVLAVVMTARTAESDDSLPQRIGASYAVAGLGCGEAVRPAPTLPLEEEPVSARLCVVGGVMPWSAPRDLLLDAGAVAAAVDRAERTPRDIDCFAVGGYAFELRLFLAGGRAVSVRGDTGGCGFVEAADGAYLGADDVLAVFLDSLADQRRTARPDRTALPTPGCNTAVDEDYALSLIGDPADIAVAVSCWRPNADEPPPWRGPVPIGPRRLAFLLADMAANSTLQKGFGRPDCPGGLDHYYWQDLVGVTRWGDTVVVRGVCRELQAAPNDFWHGDDTSEDDPERRFWHPSPRAQRILDGLRRPLPS